MQARKAFRRLRFSRFLDPGHSHQSSRISLRLRHYCFRNFKIGHNWLCGHILRELCSRGCQQGALKKSEGKCRTGEMNFDLSALDNLQKKGNAAKSTKFVPTSRNRLVSA